MQILPSSSASTAFFGSITENSSGDGFFSAMQDALDSVNDGFNYSAESALEENAPLAESPYTTHTTDGITYTTEEVLFTKQELADLRLQLLKEGASPESLSQFDILADQPNGATLAQVLASLMNGGKKPNLGEEDEHAIIAFLGQVDPAGDLSANVLDQMRAGNGLVALDLIQNAMNRSGEFFDLDPQTLAALGKGLGLNNDSLRQLSETMAGFSSLRLNGAQFDTLMNPAKNQLLTEAANAEKLDAALEKTLRPIIRKARNRMQKEAEAAERESRRVQQSKILIDKTVQGNSREMLDATVTGESEEYNFQKMGKTGAPDIKNTTDIKENFAANANNSHSALNAPNQTQNNEQIAANNMQDAGRGKSNDQNKPNGWTDLLNKVEAKTANTAQATASSFIYSLLDGSLNNESVFGQNYDMPQQAQLSRQMASQVEQGILRAMTDGSTRLDLQLHPAELGSLAITLIARNGEVTALIKSEKTETAELMQKQIDTIRVNLEQQGVRVDKIEVQLENKQDTAQNAFDDLYQHNARQEEDARRQELARLRNLAAMRNNAENSDLARSMQVMGNAARYAGQALHVVA